MSRGDGIAGIHDFLRMCNAYGEQYGVTIAIEPLNRRECNVLNTVAEGAEMVHALQLSKVRLLADAFHMCCEGGRSLYLAEGARDSSAYSRCRAAGAGLSRAGRPANT